MEKIILENVVTEICYSEKNPATTSILFWYNGMAMSGKIDLKTFIQLKEWENTTNGKV